MTGEIAPGHGRPALDLLAPAGLVAIGAMHVAWALGWRWPGGTDQAWAETLSGSPELPSVAATATVAGALFAAAAFVTAACSPRLRERPLRTLVRLAAWTVAAVLLLRAVVFLPADLTGETAIFDKLDLAVYAPLCAILGVSIALSLRRTR